MGTALLDARVDLNPHQIEAALFAMQAQPEDGRILADEVGLGKTIEAALVLTQRWAERKRRLLVIVPASLRRQWASELEDKFGLPCRVLDGPDGGAADFADKKVLICSYHFAARRADMLLAVPWDLVVLDEAHRLRAIRKSNESIAGRLVSALVGVPKILLTATPLQNSLWELYTLVTVVNPSVFGDEPSFNAAFMRGRPDYEGLRQRLGDVFHRTLRKNVLPYVKYTRRHAATFEYEATIEEGALYTAVTDFVGRDLLFCVPPRVRGLVRMLLRKLLASSPAAVASALRSLRARLEPDSAPTLDVSATFDQESLDADWLDELESDAIDRAEPASPPSNLVTEEATILDAIITSAEAIEVDSRAVALANGLDAMFTRLRGNGVPEKAVIFTESRRTQERLRVFLEGVGYAGQVATFSGTNSGPETKEMLRQWAAAHPEQAKNGQRSVNLRAAIVEHFRDHAKILIATEAGSEGLNLQFCSLVVNYDLPWNPQRVEQRIGRCHRYGQRHDVIVMNFVDRTNRADARVLELLSDKIGLFDGAIGASDSILGALESGIDIEARIHAIVDACRTPEEIDTAFAALRLEMDEVIKVRESRAQRALFDHFDDAVHDRLRLKLEAARARLDGMSRQFWSLAHWALAGRAVFEENFPAFRLQRALDGVGETGRYVLVGFEEADTLDGTTLRASHPLGEWAIERAISDALPETGITFDIANHPLRVSAVEALKGQAGWLVCERIRVDGLSDEEHIVLSGVRDDGSTLESEDVEALFSVGSRAGDAFELSAAPGIVHQAANHARQRCLRAASERNSQKQFAAQERLDVWAVEQIKAAEHALEEIRREHTVVSRRVRLASTLEESRDLQTEVQALEVARKKARTRVFGVEDEVEQKRAELLEELDRRAMQRTTVEEIFTVPWRVV